MQEGRYTRAHDETIKALSYIGGMAVSTAAGIYSTKQQLNSRNLRSYYSQRAGGDSSVKRVGSGEYRDVLERSKKQTSNLN